MSSVKPKGKRIANVFLADFTTSVDRASNGAVSSGQMELTITVISGQM